MGRPRAALVLDTGGVRFQEANGGEFAISEIICVIFEVRGTGVPVLALGGGRAEAFGAAQSPPLKPHRRFRDVG